MAKLTEKQKLFVDEYLIDLNATRAYKVAYPHVKSDGAARACASKLLTKANIKAYIDEQLEKVSSGKIADVQEVMEYLTKVMRREMKESVVVTVTKERSEYVDTGDGKQRKQSKKKFLKSLRFPQSFLMQIELRNYLEKDIHCLQIRFKRKS